MSDPSDSPPFATTKTSELIRVPDRLWGFMLPADRARVMQAIASLRAIESEIEQMDQAKGLCNQALSEGLPSDPREMMRMFTFDVGSAYEAMQVQDMIAAADKRIEELKRQSAVRVSEINGFVQSFTFDYLEAEREADRRTFAGQRKQDLDYAQEQREADLKAAAEQRKEDLRIAQENTQAAKDSAQAAKDALDAAKRQHADDLRIAQENTQAAKDSAQAAKDALRISKIGLVISLLVGALGAWATIKASSPANGAASTVTAATPTITLVPTAVPTERASASAAISASARNPTAPASTGAPQPVTSASAPTK